MLEKLPDDIPPQIAGYISHDLQAVNPQCYRAARCVQAAWRGWVTRFQKWHCDSCAYKLFMGIKRVKYSTLDLSARAPTRVYVRVTFAALPHRIVRRYMPGGLPRRCYTCDLHALDGRSVAPYHRLCMLGDACSTCQARRVARYRLGVNI